MKQIILAHGKIAIVDDDDYERINSIGSWHIDHWGYVRRSRRFIREDGSATSRTMRMHREVLNAPKGVYIDHINGNKLDNRKSNLRLCTNAQNVCNVPKRKTNTSGFKGVLVCRYKDQVRYRAVVSKDRQKNHLGYFNTAEEAAKAYNDSALKLHGEFAHLNEIPNGG